MSVSELVNAASCFNSCIPPGAQESTASSILDDIFNGGGFGEVGILTEDGILIITEDGRVIQAENQ